MQYSCLTPLFVSFQPSPCLFSKQFLDQYTCVLLLIWVQEVLHISSVFLSSFHDLLVEASTRSMKAQKVGRLWLCRAQSVVLSVYKTYWQPTPGEDTNWYFTPWKLIISNNILHTILLKIFSPLYIRFTPLHLLRLERSPLFVTWISWTFTILHSPVYIPRTRG